VQDLLGHCAGELALLGFTLHSVQCGSLCWPRLLKPLLLSLESGHHNPMTSRQAQCSQHDNT
jgi:hypothetical protein